MNAQPHRPGRVVGEVNGVQCGLEGVGWMQCLWSGERAVFIVDLERSF